jgi:hypothetical protein
MKYSEVVQCEVLNLEHGARLKVFVAATANRGSTLSARRKTGHRSADLGIWDRQSGIGSLAQGDRTIYGEALIHPEFEKREPVRRPRFITRHAPVR